MGTHLPEIRHCLSHLGGQGETEKPLRLCLPEGLEWEAEENTVVESYQAESAHWVLNPDAPGSVFLLLDPRLSPVPQLEKLAGDLEKCLLEPVKVVTCVDCAGMERHPPLRAWYDACLYYSDIVLLGNRTDSSNRFIREYTREYEHRCYPCLFYFLKKEGVPDHPLEILTPGTRRLSQLFDLDRQRPVPEPRGVVIEASCDLDLEEVETDPFRSPSPQEGLPRPVPDVGEWVVWS